MSEAESKRTEEYINGLFLALQGQAIEYMNAVVLKDNQMSPKIMTECILRAAADFYGLAVESEKQSQNKS